MNPPALPASLQELEGKERNAPHNERVRLAVRLRAHDACEYCLMPTTGQFHIDHIIPSSRWEDYVCGRLPVLPPEGPRRGPDHLDNFAWACPFCNATKGQVIARQVDRDMHRLFDPRRDHWEDHFVFLHNYLFITGVSLIGEATAQTLQFNDSRTGGPLGTRHDAVLVGRYPPIWARSWGSQR